MSIEHTHLIEDCDPSILRLLVELHHRRRDIARRYTVDLLGDRRLDDLDVVYVRDERDDKIVLAHCLLERGGIVDVE